MTMMTGRRALIGLRFFMNGISNEMFDTDNPHIRKPCPSEIGLIGL